MARAKAKLHEFTATVKTKSGNEFAARISARNEIEARRVLMIQQPGITFVKGPDLVTEKPRKKRAAAASQPDLPMKENGG